MLNRILFTIRMAALAWRKYNTPRLFGESIMRDAANHGDYLMYDVIWLRGLITSHRMETHIDGKNNVVVIRFYPNE